MDPDGRLTGKVAVVTGSGRGIGRAIAVAYAREGARVCCAARTGREIEATVAAIRADGGEALAVETDITDNDAVERMFQRAAAAFGGIDIAVLNAGGYLAEGSVEQSDPADWRLSIEINLIGAYQCARAVVPYLRQRGAGKIITVGSGLGHRGRPGSSAYSCAKAGLSMLTRVLALELWREKISVNELIPGPVQAEIDPESTARTIGRLGQSEWIKTPEDVVPLALFLATQPEIGPTAQAFSLMRRDG